MTSIRQVYRRVLRAVDNHVTRVSSNAMWRTFLQEEFRKHSCETDPKVVESLTRQADEYAMLVKTVHEHKDLLVSYNITTDKEAQQYETVQKIAKRVGLQIPDKVDFAKPIDTQESSNK